MLEYIKKIEVQEEHIDNLDHVNNRVYVAYFEEARLEWYEEAGLPFKEMQNRKIGTVVRKLEVNFIKESRLGDTLTLVTKPLRLGNTSFSLKQDIYNEHHEHLTEAIVTTVMFDMKNRKSMKVVDELARHFQ